MSCGAAEAAWVANADNHVRNFSWGPLGDPQHLESLPPLRFRRLRLDRQWILEDHRTCL
jgi:hypothetical protein